MYLLFDIGATKMRLGISEDHKTLNETRVIPTPENFEEALIKFRDLSKEIVGSRKIDKSGGGVRGVLNKKKDRLNNDHLLTDWVGKPLVRRISEITSSQVFLENDTAMCGLGEAEYGSGRGFGIVTYMTISSGVGGVRIVNGKIDENIFGFEPGHQIIDADASIFPESKKEFLELEDCVSGKALEERFRLDPRDITDLAVWQEIEKLLSIGITNTILHWSPEVVVLGGGIAQDEQMSVDRINRNIKKYLGVFSRQPKIKKGELKDLAGLYGALFRLQKV